MNYVPGPLPFVYNIILEVVSGVVEPSVTIRQMERGSIRAFMEQHKEKLKGRVLDFGAGEQPYRDLVEGEYVPFDLDGIFPENDLFDVIICNQVLQYAPRPVGTLEICNAILQARRGVLILTYATNWDEVPNDCYGDHCDRWRFTKKGMEDLLDRAGFEVLDHQRRCEVRVGAFTFPIGYGVVARAR